VVSKAGSTSEEEIGRAAILDTVAGQTSCFGGVGNETQFPKRPRCMRPQSQIQGLLRYHLGKRKLHAPDFTYHLVGDWTNIKRRNSLALRPAKVRNACWQVNISRFHWFLGHHLIPQPDLLFSGKHSFPQVSLVIIDPAI